PWRGRRSGTRRGWAGQAWRIAPYCPASLWAGAWPRQGFTKSPSFLKRKGNCGNHEKLSEDRPHLAWPENTWITGNKPWLPCCPAPLPASACRPAWWISGPC
ncbi:hypothetical protein HMPREF0731_4423, partial [Pseudoroseomonas cervicalis ATCC 49957]